MDDAESQNGARPVLPTEMADWQSAIGRYREQCAVADSEVLKRFSLAAGLDRDMNPLAHWALFFDAVADDQIGADGHPQRGDFLPAIHLPRRMFAAAELMFHRPITPDCETRCVSRIAALDHKRGRSGDLIFVKVQRQVFQDDVLCTDEVQTLVYKPDGEPLDPVPESHTRSAGESWTPGPVQLFRFSAVTFNSHRIHYDLPYAQKAEGYPNLVVHGPFTAVKLLDYASRLAGKPAKAFSFRGLAPMFVSQPIVLTRGDDPDSYLAVRCDGTIGMTATIRF